MDGHRHAVTSADGTEIGLLPDRDHRPAADEVAALRDAPRGYDVMPIVSATMPRESQALSTVDLKALATGVEVPVLLILGGASPAWARELTEEVAAALEHKTLAVLDGQGHDAIDRAPELLVTQLGEFLS
jgi:pimeloyl-ACP methyl ester carboxylesterase